MRLLCCQPCAQNHPAETAEAQFRTYEKGSNCYALNLSYSYIAMYIIEYLISSLTPLLFLLVFYCVTITHHYVHYYCHESQSRAAAQEPTRLAAHPCESAAPEPMGTQRGSKVLFFIMLKYNIFAVLIINIYLYLLTWPIQLELFFL